MRLWLRSWLGFRLRLRLGRRSWAWLGLLLDRRSVDWRSRSARSRSRSVGREGSWSAGGDGLLLLVKGSRSRRDGTGSRRGLVTVDSGVDDDDLSDNLGLVDERALVNRGSSGNGAEKERSEDSGSLHVDNGYESCLVVGVVFGGPRSWRVVFCSEKFLREWLNWLAVSRVRLSR